MASFVKAYRDQQIKKLNQRKPNKATKQILGVKEQHSNGSQQPGAAAVGDSGEENKDSHELIQVEQEELNIESTNKVIFELSALIGQFNKKVFEQENVSILSKCSV